MKKTLFVFAAVACLLSAVPAAAQSPLADAARREAERRRAVRAASIQTYTNEDLARLPQRVTLTVPAPPVTEVTTMGVVGSGTAPASLAGAAAQAAAPGQAAADKTAPRDETYWRARVTAVRTSLARAEIFAESLQSRINGLSADFVSRDDPAQRQQIAEQRQKALDELGRVKTEISDLLKQMADIEGEARRLKVPPGWLR